ncbi:ectonucleotide pyrophosphatase/phosphodiesterase family member 5-like [Actinia tenebrosa]|uniref:Ectonucleotide pyrophosphatase/phosphodiesterase family member 5-like n=1 Tax=Actinia tenebrosa TaxID=6105 RepID=A0A6P8IIB2_ACTTE|nr:ectonucleotide pyrophosphatase/phosphodiesterase family member 5-like [Actinia tenebrosa]
MTMMFLSSIIIHLSFALLCSSNTATKDKSSPIILVSIDGLGWQFTGGKFANTTNLDYIASTGVKAKYMKTVTPTKTWPNHQTYLTGLYPESHGLVSNKFWDPIYEEKFIFDYDCTNNDPKFWQESEPIWLTLQKQSFYSGMYFWPGFSSYKTTPTYYEKAFCKVNCSAIPPKDLPLYRNQSRSSWPPYIHCLPNYSIPYRQRIDSIVSWLKSDKPPKFVAVYVDQPDWVGHSDGPKSQKFKDEIEKVDRDAVGYLVNKLREVDLLDKVNLIFVADHSFVQVNLSRLIYLDDYLDPSTFMLTESGTLIHLWPHEGKMEEIYVNLTKLVTEYPQAKLYKKDNIPEEYHLKNNRRTPPIFLDPGYGWMVEPTRTNRSSDWVYGAHGYPASEKLAAIFYARGPAFKKGYKIDHGLRSIDVYPMMCKILGIEPRPNNGSLDNMKMMLVGEEGPKATGLKIMSWSYLTLISLVIVMIPIF